MNWKQLVDRCGLFVDANRRLLLNLLYEAEEELTRNCHIYEESITYTIGNEFIDTYGGDKLPLPYTEGWVGNVWVGDVSSIPTSHFVAPIQVIVNGNKIKAMNEDEFYFNNDGTKHKGVPIGYSVYNNQLNFSHILKLSDKIKLIYYGMVADHSDLEPKIPTIYHKELCNYACYMSQIKDKPDVASVFKNLWEQSILDIRNKEGNRDATYTIKEVI